MARTSFLWLLCLLFIVGLQSEGCSPALLDPPPISTTCTTNGDCPLGDTCQQGLCSSLIKPTDASEANTNEPNNIEPTKPEPTTPDNTEPITPEPTTPEPTQPEPTQPEPEPNQPDNTEPITPEPEPITPEPNKPEHTPEPPPSCVNQSKRPCYNQAVGCAKQSDGSYKCNGECSAGTQTCTNGKWGPCQGATRPAIEICGDKLDNDCDGQTDEICGPGNALAHLVMEKGGKVAYESGFDRNKSTKSNSGEYTLKVSNRNADCGQTPIFVTPVLPSGKILAATGYQCDKKDYKIHTGKNIGSHGDFTSGDDKEDTDFHAILPDKGKNESWAHIKQKDCTKAAGCDIGFEHNFSSQQAKVKKQQTGIYIIEHPNCKTRHNPLFAMIFDKGNMGYTSVVADGKECYVYITNANNKAADLEFVVWFPDPTRWVWARFFYNTTYGIAASNTFNNDPGAIWGKQTSVNGTIRSIRPLYPSWGNTSVMLARPSERTFYGLSLSTTGITNATTPPTVTIARTNHSSLPTLYKHFYVLFYRH